jgi:hypothetical protein
MAQPSPVIFKGISVDDGERVGLGGLGADVKTLKAMIQLLLSPWLV